MRNYDESILRRQRIEPAAPWPVLHQTLRIALYDQYAARAFYLAVTQAFGQQAPFDSVVKSQAGHIALLCRLCKHYGVPQPLDSFSSKISIAPSWRSNLQRAIQGSHTSLRLQAYLAAQVLEPDVRQVLLKLQKASHQQHLPAFERALEKAITRENWHLRQGVAPSHAYVRHGPLSEALERGFALLASQHSAFGLIGSLVRVTHPVTLAGIVLGGVTVQLLRQSKTSGKKTAPASNTPFTS